MKRYKISLQNTGIALFSSKSIYLPLVIHFNFSFKPLPKINCSKLTSYVKYLKQDTLNFKQKLQHWYRATLN